MGTIATTRSKPDHLSYKLNTIFHENHVVHLGVRKRWWGATVKEKWVRVKQLGAGGQGVVYLERETKKKLLRAVKRFSMPVDQPIAHNAGFERELDILIELKDHEDLFIQFKGWFQDQNFTYLVMEYIEHGDLGKYLQEFGPRPEKDAKKIIKQVLEGLMTLHRKQICYRDLKPQNILMASLSPIHIKLADFGVSKSTIDTSLKTQCGTRGYLAPEVLGLLPRNLHQGRNYTNAVDLWALGCLIYELLSLKTPFSRPESNTTYTGVASDVPRLLEVDTMILTQFCSGQISLPTEALENYKVSNDCIYIVRQLLVADPHSRISAEDALGSEWLLDLSDFLLTDYGTIQSQLLSLGVDVSLQVANKMLMHYRGLTKMDPREVLPPDTDPIPLVDTAISSGYVFLSKVLLRIWTKVGSGESEWRHYNGLTLLQRAAEVGNPRIVNMLIEDGMDVNATPYNERGRTALQAAAQHGHLKIVELLLKKNVNINADPCYAYGRTALQAASEGGHLDIVGLLLENGADVNAQRCNFWGKTAIQAAEEGLHSEVARLLLKNGAGPLEHKLTEYKSSPASPHTRIVG